MLRFDEPLPTRDFYSKTVEVTMPSDVLGAYVGSWTEQHEDDVRLAQEFLSRFTYKPGWFFEILRKPELPVPVVLTVKFMALDSRGVDHRGVPHLRECHACQGFTGAHSPIAGSFPLPMKLSLMGDAEKFFFDFLRNTIWFVERHESDEWFRVGGELRYDPHANDWATR